MNRDEFYERFSLPQYVGKGEVLEIYPCGSGSYQLCVTNTDSADALEYIKEIEMQGYSLLEDNCVGESLFRVYCKGEKVLWLSYVPNSADMRIVCGEKNFNFSRINFKRAYRTTPSVTQLAVKLGMCYCITLFDGTFILVDGGVANADDVKMIYEFLSDNSGGDEKPVIRAWLMSHTHPDHTGVAKSFMTTYRDCVEMLETVYNFPDFASVEVLHESAESNHKAALDFISTVKTCYPNAEHTVCHTGERLVFPGVTVTTVMTHEDVYPSPITSSNSTSCAWRFDFGNGGTFMCLGDVWTHMCQRLAQSFPAEYLKSDVMQVTHHGLLGGHIELYRAIDPEICFWPTPEERFSGTWTDPRRVALGKPTVQYCIGEGGCDYNEWLRNEDIKRRKHYHAGKNVTVRMEK